MFNRVLNTPLHSTRIYSRRILRKCFQSRIAFKLPISKDVLGQQDSSIQMYTTKQFFDLFLELNYTIESTNPSSFSLLQNYFKQLVLVVTCLRGQLEIDCPSAFSKIARMIYPKNCPNQTCNSTKRCNVYYHQSFDQYQ